MLRAFFFCLFAALFSTLLLGQDDCYRPLRKEGLVLLQNKEYRKAIDKLFAARYCPDKPAKDDLDDQIKKTLDTWVKALDDAKKDAENATKVALLAREAEAKARQQAEENATIARRRGKLAEGLRLAVLAENERLRGNKRDALLLSFLSLELVPRDSSGLAIYIFGKTVRDSFATILASSEIPFVSVENITDSVHLIQLNNGQIKIIDRDRILPLTTSQMGKTTALFSKVNQLIITYGTDGGINFYDLDARLLKTLTGHTEAMMFTALSHDEKKMITGSRDNNAILWDIAEGSKVILSQHKGNIYGGEFSPDDQAILLRSSDATASIWSTNGKLMNTIGKNEIYIYAATFSTKSPLILTAAASGMAKLWNAEGKILKEMSHPTPVKKAFFSPNGQQIITLGTDLRATIWDAQGNLIRSLGESNSLITALALNADGAKVLSGSKDGKIQLWDNNGILLKNLGEESEEIYSVTFSADGTHLLATTKAGICKVWDKQGNLLMDISLNNNNPIAARFSTTGSSIITSENNNLIIKNYPLPTVIYQKLTLPQILKSTDYQRLKQEYRIQFIEEK